MTNRLAFEIHGYGPTLLFLPGLGLDRQIFNPLLPLLTNEYRVVLVDNLGAGESPVPKGPYTIEQMARMVMEILEEYHFYPCALLGHSMGGFIAQTIALNHPAYVSRLVLLCSAPSFVDTTLVTEKSMKRKGDSLRNVIYKRVSSFVGHRFIENHPDQFNQFVDHRLTHPTKAAGFDGQVAAARGFDLTHRLGQIHTPTLVVAGNEDQLIPTNVSEAMAQLIPNSTLKWLTGVGHLPQLEATNLTASLIKKFVE